MERNKVLLFTGILFFGLAGIVFLLELHPLFFWLLMGAGISMKIGFVVSLMRGPDFKVSVGLILIFIGVALILTSLLFKYVYPVVWLRNILFYSAILLKISGVALLLLRKRGVEASRRG